MATPLPLGTIKEFNPEVERITPYLERLALFLTANKVEEGALVPAFLSIIGSKAYSVLRDLLAPTLPKEVSYETLVTTLKKHYEPNIVVIAERFRFHRCCQESDMSIAEFLAEIRHLATHCEFGNYLDEALRDRLVCGLRSDAIQKKLLTEVNLTLSMAVEIAKGMEAAEKNAKSLKSVDPVIQKLTVDGRESKMPCHRCGKWYHSPSTCRFAQATCHSCGERGHIAPVCPAREDGRKSSRGRGRKFKGTNWLDTDIDQTPEETNLRIYHVDSKARPISVKLKVNGKELSMEVDTGAALSIISQEMQHHLFPEAVLTESQVFLRTYTGETMPVVGEMSVRVEYKDQVESLTLTVVKGNGPCLFGRDWLEKIRLNWGEIRALNSQPMPEGVQNLCDQYAEVFEEKLGTIHPFEASIRIDEAAESKFMKARSVPYSIRDVVGEELDRMESEGTLEQITHSEWATPIVAIPKADGRYRICGDFKVTLNPVMAVDQYPLPKPQDLFAKLSGGKKFTILDLSQAYLQLMLDEQSQKLTVINTHKGLYRFKRLPFGIASAPAMFQKVMDTILQGIPRVICYIDDIMITGATEEEHLKNLEEVLCRLRSHGFRLKLSKCQFLRDSVDYLGLVVDEQGVHTSSEKTKAVLNAPQPRNVKALRSFLGMMNYYRKFIPNLASTLKPLTILLKKNCRWFWKAEQAKAFREAKQLLTVSPVLIHYDATLPVRLATDASAHGIGAVISHVLPEGEEKPIAYASRTLTSTESKYAQIDKEALGIVFGVRKFHQYLYGRKFTLVTDHKPLTAIFGPKRGVPALAAARLQRWAVQLSAYDYNIEFRTTAKHANADGLSRLPLTGGIYTEEGAEVRVFQVRQLEALPIRVRDVKRATQSDHVLRRVLHFTREGWPASIPEELKPYFSRKDEMSIENGCLLWGMRVIIPTCLRKQLLVELHRSHPGVVRMKSLARSHMWWPRMDSEIERVAKTCETCHAAKQTPAKAPLSPWSWPSRPWQRVHIDYAGPFLGKHFLLLVDAHSKWGEVIEMNSTTTSKTIEALRQSFAAYGLPQQIVSDNGPQFTSEEFSAFLRGNGIKHHRCTPYHPSSNGEAERFVRTFKESIKASCRDGLTLSHRIQNFLLMYRSTPHATTNRAPCELFLGRKVRTRLDLIQPNVEEQVFDQQVRQKDHHDLQAKCRDFEVGTKVMVKDRRPGSATWIPGKITCKNGPLTYVVSVPGDRSWKCHVDQLKECLEESSAVQTRALEGDMSNTDSEFDYSFVDDVPDLELPKEDSAASVSEITSDEVSENTGSGTTEEIVESPLMPRASVSNPPIQHRYPLRDRAKHRRFN